MKEVGLVLIYAVSDVGILLLLSLPVIRGHGRWRGRLDVSLAWRIVLLGLVIPVLIGSTWLLDSILRTHGDADWTNAVLVTIGASLGGLVFLSIISIFRTRE
jgi:hypothetical protein